MGRGDGRGAVNDLAIGDYPGSGRRSGGLGPVVSEDDAVPGGGSADIGSNARIVEPWEPRPDQESPQWRRRDGSGVAGAALALVAKNAVQFEDVPTIDGAKSRVDALIARSAMIAGTSAACCGSAMMRRTPE